MDHNEAAVAADMYDFLQQFMKAHPKLQALPFFAFGESFAGHYVPAVTHKIWQMNRALPKGSVRIHLHGTAIGNGLTDPLVQFGYYAQMAVSTNGHAPAVRARRTARAPPRRYSVSRTSCPFAQVSNATHALMELATPPCKLAIRACQAAPASYVAATRTRRVSRNRPPDRSPLR